MVHHHHGGAAPGAARSDARAALAGAVLGAVEGHVVGLKAAQVLPDAARLHTEGRGRMAVSRVSYAHTGTLALRGHLQVGTASRPLLPTLNT